MNVALKTIDQQSINSFDFVAISMFIHITFITLIGSDFLIVCDFSIKFLISNERIQKAMGMNIT